MQRFRDEMEEDEDIQQWDRTYDLTAEDKVYYGSDSTDIDYSSDEDAQYGYGDEELGEGEGSREIEYYDEEDPGLGSAHDDSEDSGLGSSGASEGSLGSGRRSSQSSRGMEFDGPPEEEKQEENPYAESSDRRSSISSSDSSKHSKRIIEFDEDDQIIEAKPGSTLEMVDLKAKPTPN